MPENEKQKGKFESFGITPKTINIPVDATTTSVNISGTVKSQIEHMNVEITFTHPDGKVETNSYPYAESGTQGIFNFKVGYGVNKATKTGKYKVVATLVENKNEVRTGEFQVNPPDSK